jgi:hypothetical protein
MLSPARLTELLVEFVFLLLGALVVWLGVTRHINFVPGGTAWLVISVALLVWGLIAFAKPGVPRARWQKWIRGSSLLLLGILMLSMMRVPFMWVGNLLALAGVVLIVRGLAGMLLILRQR